MNLAVHSDEADDLIEQLIATPRENVQRFKKKLSGLKQSGRFIDWRDASGFSRELEMLLQDVKAGVDDPLTGIKLVAAFYEADNTIFEMCDDSSGNTGKLRESDAKFLIAVGKIDEAEEYLPGRADQLDGNHYNSLLSLAEAMGAENRNLVTSLIYRSLLISVLERGYTKAYPHGVRYLKKLDKLATSVAGWKEFNHHEAFKEQIIQTHGRKRSFWSKYAVMK